MTAKAYALQMEPQTASGPVRALKSLARGGLKAVLPAPWYWRFLARRIGHFDVELRLLPYLCDRNKASVDVGASTGSYTVHLLNHSTRCYAFEPIPESGAFLIRRLTSRPHRRLRLESVAVSDHSGEARLKVMTADTGRSTIEAANEVERAGPVEVLTVPMRRLDDYADAMGPIGCIKIDVEGHEEAVLRGAANLLRRDHPSLIIEIEERHKPGSLQAVQRFLGELGYRGFFYRGGSLRPMETFRAEQHQDVAAIATKVAGESAYVNNFLFFAEASLQKVRHLIDGR
jgi:FkbM family methyltransferase